MEEEDSVVGSEIAGSSACEREELSSSQSETPVDIEEVTPSRKGSRKRKKISDKFELMEGLLEKMIKIQEDSEKASTEVELKIFDMEERRQKESQDLQMRLLSLLLRPQHASNKHTTPSPEHTWNFKCKPKAFHVMCTVTIIYIQTSLGMMTYNLTVFVVC